MATPRLTGSSQKTICPPPLVGDIIIGLSVQQKKFNIDCQDGRHLRFPIRMTLSTFDQQVTSILPGFESMGHLVQKKKFKIDFQHGG